MMNRPLWCRSVLGLILLMISAVTQAQCTGTAAYTIPADNWSEPEVPMSPSWTSNVPPAVAGQTLMGAPHCEENPPYSANCNVCPSYFSATLSATGNRVVMYLCRSNTYTISLCTSSDDWDSEISVTNTSSTVLFAYDDDGCGTSNGHATVIFDPPNSGLYLIKVHGNGCTPPPANGTIIIACSQGPCPGPGDNPCASTPLATCNPNFVSCGPVPGAIPFPALGVDCTTLSGSTAFMTGTLTVDPPTCGVYPSTGDIWFTALSSANGTLALDIHHVSATNLAMALYTVAGACPTPELTAVACNNDLVQGSDLEPYLSVSGLQPFAIHYIRVWPEAHQFNGGSFQLCAYWPVAPVNDQPCGAIELDMSNPFCSPATFNTQDATPLTSTTTSPSSPSCGDAGNDLWFTITVPEAGRVTLNTIAGSLTNMAMALYTGDCEGPLTEIACNDNSPLGGNMPYLNPSTVFTAGQVLWIRVWNRTNGFGTFQICAYMTQPPANDEPCGAFPIEPLFGCLMTEISTENATQTNPDLYGSGSIPDPSCGGTPNNDVWFSVVVPANGEFALDMDDATMDDAAMAVYRRIAGDCPEDASFSEVSGACFVSGSSNPGAGAMPAGTVTGLTPGETVYIRVWRQSGLSGSGHLCVRRTDTLPVQPGVLCYYTLRMTDTAGDGWNGSYVTIQIGAAPPVNYTIDGGAGYISFPVSLLDPVAIFYTAVGGFQNEIQFHLVNNYAGIVFGSTSPPSNGLNYIAAADCYPPPPGPGDCDHAYFRVHPSLGEPVFASQNSPDQQEDLNTNNRGCLLLGEQGGTWLSFLMLTSGPFAYEVVASDPSTTDFDFALWGPLDADECPPTTGPIRCSFAAGAGSTGLNFIAQDESEDANGDGWVAHVDVLAGEEYLMYVNGHTPVVGSFQLIPILSTGQVEMPASGYELQLIPNPVTRSNTDLLILLEQRSALHISIQDATGRLVHASTMELVPGRQRIPLDTKDLRGGSYVVRVSSQDAQHAARSRVLIVAE